MKGQEVTSLRSLLRYIELLNSAGLLFNFYMAENGKVHYFKYCRNSTKRTINIMCDTKLASAQVLKPEKMMWQPGKVLNFRCFLGEIFEKSHQEIGDLMNIPDRYDD